MTRPRPVRVDPRFLQVVEQRLGPERTTSGSPSAADVARYAGYQQKTDREIPLVFLRPTD